MRLVYLFKRININKSKKNILEYKKNNFYIDNNEFKNKIIENKKRLFDFEMSVFQKKYSDILNKMM